MMLPRSILVITLGLLITIGLPITAAASDKSGLQAQLSIDRQQARVGEQVRVRLLISAPAAAFSITHDPVAFSQGKLIPLARKKYKKTENNSERQYVDATWALFGTTAGNIDINAVTVRATLPMSAAETGATQNPKVAISTDALTITIDSSDNQQQPWFTATGVTLNSEWPSGTQTLIAGVPVTRHLKIIANGQLPAAIPPLLLESIEGVRVYPGVPDLALTKQPDAVTGTRVETMTLMLSEPGTITLPPVFINWWNSENQTWQQSHTPAETLQVAPGTQTTSNGQTDIFKLIATALALLCCILAGLSWWLWRRYQHALTLTASKAAPSVSEENTWRALQAVLRDNDQGQLRTALRHWLKAYDLSVEQLAEIEPQLAERLNEINQSLYAAPNQSGSSPRMNTLRVDLLPAFKQLRQRLKTSKRKNSYKRNSGTTTLYPSH